MNSYKVLPRGMSMKGYMVVNDMKIISKHRTKEGADKALNKILKSFK